MFPCKLGMMIFSPRSGRTINYLYWASVPVLAVLVDRPYHCQSISGTTAVELRQTSRRNQPIYRGTMGQHDSIVSRRLCINWLSLLFFAPTSIPRPTQLLLYLFTYSQRDGESITIVRGTRALTLTPRTPCIQGYSKRTSCTIWSFVVET